MPYYPESYHLAANYLVAFGGHNGNTAWGRQLIATALRDLRRQHGRDAAQRERLHLLFISGQFPVKTTQER